jgi:hypothetical protein
MIVPVSRPKRASRANGSQVACSQKLKKLRNLRGKTKLAEKLIDV